MYLIRGSWNLLTIYCGHHDIPVEMQIDSGHQNISYGCPYEAGEPGKRIHCQNRIKLTEYEEILGYISNLIVKAEMNAEVVHLENTEWKSKSGLKCRIIKHNEHSIEVVILNPKAAARQHTGY